MIPLRRRTWFAALAALVRLRVVRGVRPAHRLRAGSHAAAREVLASFGRLGLPLLAFLAVAAVEPGHRFRLLSGYGAPP